MKTLVHSFLRYWLPAWLAALALVPAADAARPVRPTVYAFNVFGETTINRGETATLNWSVSNGATVSISPGVGVIDGTQVDVTPQETTTYTLTATNAAGSVTRTKKITVIVPPVFQSLAATPETIVAGKAVKLSWSAPGAAYFTVTTDVGPDVGNVFANQVTVRPAETTEYTVTAVNTAGTDTRTIVVPVVPKGQKPVIGTFTASPATVGAGQEVTLSWTVSGATTLSISPDVGPVTGGSVVVKPTATTSYTLTAGNPNGSVSRTVSVTVTAAPVIGAFTAEPAEITAGDAATLSWQVDGAETVTLSPGFGEVTGSSIQVFPTTTTTYTLAARNVAGEVTRETTVTVNAPVPAPEITAFTATPASVTAGQSTTLAWTVNGADTIEIAANVGQSPGVVTGDSVTITPSATTIYKLTATNSGGATTRTVQVTVDDPAPVIGSFVVYPNTITAGESTMLYWDVTGAVSLSISADVGPSPGVVTGNSREVTPAATTLYTMTATSASGKVTTSVTQVIVAEAPPLPVPTIISFGANPSNLVVGDSTTFSWLVDDADTVSITADKGESPGPVTGTSTTLSPAETTVYTLTATNTYGSVQQTATVTVHEPQAPIIASFTATPAFIQAGATSRLEWSISGAQSVEITADAGESPGVVTGTQVPVSPAVTTTYTLSATNAIGTSTAQTVVTLYTPGDGTVIHPRIWLTPERLAVLAQRAQGGDAAWLKLRAECDRLANFAVRYPDQNPADNTINGGYQYNDYLDPSVTLALGYAVAKTADPARAAKYLAKERELLLALADTVHHGSPSVDHGYGIRGYVPALAIGYDWCHEALSEDERAQVYSEINRWIDYFDTDGFGRNFPQGNYFAGYYDAKALGALATEGENPRAAAMWTDWLQRLHYGMVQPYHQQWLRGGGVPDGWNYGRLDHQHAPADRGGLHRQRAGSHPRRGAPDVVFRRQRALGHAVHLAHRDRERSRIGLRRRGPHGDR